MSKQKYTLEEIQRIISPQKQGSVSVSPNVVIGFFISLFIGLLVYTYLTETGSLKNSVDDLKDSIASLEKSFQQQTNILAPKIASNSAAIASLHEDIGEIKEGVNIAKVASADRYYKKDALAFQEEVRGNQNKNERNDKDHDQRLLRLEFSAKKAK